MKGENSGAKQFFCTYFDENYLVRALALVHSLERHAPNFQLYALCVDDVSYQALVELRHPNVVAIALRELERADRQLLDIKHTRSRVEYYWTCGPAFILFVLEHYTSVDFLSYVDADIFFFSSPQPLYEEMLGCSIGIIEHRFAARHQSRNKYGIFNVGWMGFRRDSNSLQCLRWWHARCLEWCFDLLEQDRFGDQKYLEEWPRRFNGVRIVQHKGANVGPWNLANHPIVERGGQIFIAEELLIFFHFHGFRQLTNFLYDTNLSRWGYRPPKVVRRNIFGVYVNALHAVYRDDIVGRSLRHEGKSFFFRSLRLMRQFALGIVFQSYLIVHRGRVL